jgi:predicted ATPase/DNA-binding CsgD family transcriptional regulator/DNA-binding XRE family transcriptional regulator
MQQHPIQGKTFAALLRSHRTTAGLTQEALAEKAGLSRRGIADLERGARLAPHTGTVERLAAGLELSETGRDALVAAARIRGPDAAVTVHPLTSGEGTATPTRRKNLPAHRVRLIGREEDLASARHALIHADGRLLTLTGTGGCGKTRLALELASTLVEEFFEGVWLVELAPVADAALVPQTILATLGLHERAGEPAISTMIGSIDARRLLLVLDNCEHLIDTSAGVVEQLLEGCPNLRVLATSREPLRIAGELTWVVPSLAVPDAQVGLDRIMNYPAVELFAERARAAWPDFTLTHANAPTVATICRRLDGMPLALELAAARARTLEVDQILDRLDDSIRLLVGGSRTAPTRQQTMRATLDWSYGLLGAAEQTLFRSLAVFAGSASLEAVDAVCDASRFDADVLDMLDLLVDKSLVQAVKRDGRARYRLLEPVRQYALERLTGPDAVDPASTEPGLQSARRQHAAFFLALAEHSAPKIHGADQWRWLNTLEQEHANFRAALTFSGEDHDGATALRLAGVLAGFWLRRGYVREGREWLDRALVTGAQAAPGLRLVALSGAGSLASFDHDLQFARAVQSEALALARTLADEHSTAVSLNSLGYTEFSEGNYTAAEALLAEGLDHFQTLEDPVGIALSLFGLANLAATRDDDARAVALFSQSLAEARASGDAWRIASCLHGLGHLAWRAGDTQQASALLGESLAGSAALRDQRGLAVCFESLALVACGRRPLHSARLFGAASVLRTQTGARRRGWLDADFERGVERARSALGEPAFNAAVTVGRGRPIEESIADALAGPATADQHRVGPLSPREGEVALLVTRGLTNRQIGETLVITGGTAALHVKNALRKLGFKSRAQLAAWSTQQAELSTLHAMDI